MTQIHVRVKFSNNKYCYDSKHILNILETFEYIAHESTTFFMPFYFRKQLENFWSDAGAPANDD